MSSAITKIAASATCRDDGESEEDEEDDDEDEVFDEADEVNEEVQARVPHAAEAVLYFGGRAWAAFEQLRNRDYSSFADDKAKALVFENLNPISTQKLLGPDGRTQRPTFFFGDNGQGDLVAAMEAIQTRALTYGMIRIG